MQCWTGCIDSGGFDNIRTGSSASGIICSNHHAIILAGSTKCAQRPVWLTNHAHTYHIKLSAARCDSSVATLCPHFRLPKRISRCIHCQWPQLSLHRLASYIYIIPLGRSVAACGHLHRCPRVPVHHGPRCGVSTICAWSSSLTRFKLLVSIIASSPTTHFLLGQSEPALLDICTSLKSYFVIRPCLWQNPDVHRFTFT
jgi:hypothetical protein